MFLHHVSIPARPEAFDFGRAFYGELLGLEEIPPPVSLEPGRVVWFQVGDSELHLFKEDRPNAVPSGRHFCFAIDDLDSARSRLEAAGVRVEDTVPIHNRPRFFCWDPFGNQLELTSILGPYE